MNPLEFNGSKGFLVFGEAFSPIAWILSVGNTLDKSFHTVCTIYLHLVGNMTVYVQGKGCCTFEGDAQEILADFLNHCHYAAEE